MLNGVVGASWSKIAAAGQTGNGMSSAVVFAFLVVFLVADLTLADQQIRNEIKLIENGYEDVLIAIGEAVPLSESDKIISRIKVGSF